MTRNLDAEKIETLDEGWLFMEKGGWLSTCNKQVRQALRSIAQYAEFDAGDYLYRFGEGANGVFGLVGGTLDSLVPRLDGEEMIIHRAMAGYWVGDLALFANNERLVSLRAATPVKVIYLPKQKLVKLANANPALLQDFFRLTHENVAMLFTVLSNLAVPGAQKRVAIRILLQQKLDPGMKDWIEIGQESLAELLALSTQTVRRALRDLEKRGLIEHGYRRIRIVDQKRLAKLCSS